MLEVEQFYLIVTDDQYNEEAEKIILARGIRSIDIVVPKKEETKKEAETDKEYYYGKDKT